MTQSRLRIAILGTRGIPANYGGFETCAEQVATRMAAAGHEVTVYCRSQYMTDDAETYKGVRLARLPTIQNKYLDTPVHSLLSAVHALRRSYDVIYLFGVGNSPVAGLLQLGPAPVILNVDGLDWKREKWPWFAKTALRTAERIAGPLADLVITDSLNVQHYYRRTYGANLAVVPYGADPRNAENFDIIPQLGLTPGRYILYVGRLEPENGVHTLLEASRRANLGIPTVIVGDAPYNDQYKDTLQAMAGPETIFAGALYGDDYWALNQNAGLYVFPVTSSGTHPALIEAMASGNHVLVRDTPDNRAAGGAAVDYFTDVPSLVELLHEAWDNPGRSDVRGEEARDRAITLFNWDRVSEQYLELAHRALNTGKEREPATQMFTTAQESDSDASRIVELDDTILSLVFGSKADTQLSAGISEDDLMRRMALHGVGPLLGERMTTGQDLVTPRVDTWLREQASLNRQRLDLLRDDVQRILAAFQHYKLQAIPLKGTAMLLDPDRDVGWRPMADLDLLVQHDSQQEIDLAYAHAGYCLPPSFGSGLSGLNWKHRHYVPCEWEWPEIDALGEHPDHPRDIESHPAVREMHAGIGWDITRWITANLTSTDSYVIPSERAIALHLAVHCSINALESQLRLIHLVDLERQIERAGTSAILHAVQKSGAPRHARFVYPALALTARWSGNLTIAKAASLLEPNVPVGMAEWCAHATLADFSWKPDRTRSIREDLQRWPVSIAERAHLAGHAILPLPRDLDSQGYRGEGARAILGWYPRYYRETARRTLDAARSW